MIVTQKESEELLATYLVANTPLYLYRHFRRSPIIQRLAEQHRPGELAAFIVDVGKQTERVPGDVAAAYAAAVALTFLDRGSVDPLINELNLRTRDLHWLAQIFAMWRQRRIQTSTSRVSLPTVAPRPREGKSATSTSVTLLPKVVPACPASAASTSESTILLPEE